MLSQDTYYFRHREQIQAYNRDWYRAKMAAEGRPVRKYIPHVGRSHEDRFMDRVVKEPERGCWLWIGALTDRGYGVMTDSKVAKSAHRASWVIFRGPIPQGLCVCHKCDVRNCVNPEHLFLGTVADNNRDMARKGRTRNPNARINEGVAAEIRYCFSVCEHGEKHDMVLALAERFSLTPSYVRDIIKGRTWVDIPKITP